MEGFFALLRRPYHLYKQRKHRRIFAFIFAGFAWFLLFVFGVFEFDYFAPLRRLYLTGIYALACWLASMINFFVIQETFFKKYTIGNAFLLSVSIMATIGFFNYLLTTLFFQWEPFSLGVFIKNQLFTLAIGVIIIPFVILAHYSYTMRRRTRALNRPAALMPEAMILLESDYKHGNLELDARDLLFIKSADNYIDVCYLEGSSIRHSLLRSTLSATEKVIDSPQVVRCHRSYMINLFHINSSKRYLDELKLQLNGKEYLIPVSRRYRERVRSVLANLR